MWKRLNLRRFVVSFQGLQRSLEGYSPFQDWRLLLLLAVLSLAGYWMCPRIVFSLSPSLSHRVFLITERSNTQVKKGDYVIFHLSSQLLDNGKSKKVIKEVSCVPGDWLHVDTRNRFFYCNGQYLGKAKESSLKGKPLPLFTYDGRIPEGKLFVSGQHKDSFDSRYWGFLEQGRVERLARPLL